MKHCNYCNEPLKNDEGQKMPDKDILCPSCVELYKARTITNVNYNFVIKYASTEKPTKFYLIGAGQYFKLVGEELAEKHFLKALNSKGTKTTFKLRRGLKIVFHSK